MMKRLASLLFFLVFCSAVEGRVWTGLDRIFHTSECRLLDGKRVGLITNQTAVDGELRSSVDLFKRHQGKYRLVALFAPEHGLNGVEHADEKVLDRVDRDGIPIHSLHGETRRPTEAMLKGVDLLVFDIQDVGTRSYTYASTLYYCMEEAAKRNIGVVVLDRPNPINGVTVDGPMLKEERRSFIGYVNVPFCHGMTMGELAQFFNGEYGIGCDLTVVKMQGWSRSMTFGETGLPWVPTSPHIPHVDSPLYYPMTNLVGDLLTEVNIGVGYTLPFQVFGATWMDGELMAQKLSEQKLPGVKFHAFHFKPFFGRCKMKACSGVRIVVSDPTLYRPVTTQFMILGLIKSLYPKEFARSLIREEWRQNLFCKAVGTSEALKIVGEEKFIAWKLIGLDEKERKKFLVKRRPYLLYRNSPLS